MYSPCRVTFFYNHFWSPGVKKYPNHNYSIILGRSSYLSKVSKIANQWIEPMIARRSANSTISHQPSVTKAMLAIGVQPGPSPSASNQSKKRGRCQSCPRKSDSKSDHRCTKCNHFVCGKHANKTTEYSCITCPLTLSEDVE